MAERDDFERLREAICSSCPASDGDDLLGMEIDCGFFLGDPSHADDRPDLWHTMQVHRSEGSAWLVSGQGAGRREDAPAIARRLAATWEQHLCYGYRSAHTVSTTTDAVILRAVTQIRPHGFWVTAKVEVAISA